MTRQKWTEQSDGPYLFPVLETPDYNPVVLTAIPCAIRKNELYAIERQHASADDLHCIMATTKLTGENRRLWLEEGREAAIARCEEFAKRFASAYLN